jgi:hypothetical protein
MPGLPLGAAWAGKLGTDRTGACELFLPGLEGNWPAGELMGGLFQRRREEFAEKNSFQKKNILTGGGRGDNM